MTDLLYHTDAYLRESTPPSRPWTKQPARFYDRTAFYPGRRAAG
jgi:hypothetical protein